MVCDSKTQAGRHGAYCDPPEDQQQWNRTTLLFEAVSFVALVAFLWLIF